MFSTHAIDLRAAELLSLCDAAGTPIPPDRARFFAAFERSDESVLAVAAERYHRTALSTRANDLDVGEPTAEDIDEGAREIMDAFGVDYITALGMLEDDDGDDDGEALEALGALGDDGGDGDDAALGMLEEMLVDDDAA